MSSKRRAGLTAFLLIALCGAAAYAAQTGPDMGGTRELTLGYIFERGGPTMWVLLLMSVGAVALVVYYFITMRAEQVAPRSFLRRVVGQIHSGDFKEVRAACGEQPCPLGEVVLAGLDYVETVPARDPMMLKEMMESEGGRQAAEIQVQPQYLLDMAILSPMVGLLGSVFGMFTSFNAVALDPGKAKPMLLAAGVSEALFATAGGLIIGIPAMAFYGYFRSRASRLVSRLEGGSSEVLSAFLKGMRP